MRAHVHGHLRPGGACAGSGRLRLAGAQLHGASASEHDAAAAAVSRPPGRLLPLQRRQTAATGPSVTPWASCMPSRPHLRRIFRKIRSFLRLRVCLALISNNQRQGGEICCGKHLLKDMDRFFLGCSVNAPNRPRRRFGAAARARRLFAAFFAAAFCTAVTAALALAFASALAAALAAAPSAEGVPSVWGICKCMIEQLGPYAMPQMVHALLLLVPTGNQPVPQQDIN